MKKAQKYAERQKNREGYFQVKNRFGDVIDEIPLDFPDPARLTIDDYWLEYLAILWMASGSTVPPTIEEVRWRDRNVDEQVASYRMMLEFYMKYDKRPGTLRDAEGVDWIDLVREDN